MSSKKILIAEHAQEANAFIEKLETRLLPAVRYIQTAVKNTLGVDLPPGKEPLVEIASGHYDDLKALYWQVAYGDVESFKSVAAKEQTKGIIEETFWDFTKRISLRFSETIDTKPLNNPAFLKLFELNEAGEPVIPETVKEAIRESFKEFLMDPAHIKLHEAQQKAAKALEQLAAAMQENGLRPIFPAEMLRTFEIMTDTEDRWLFKCNEIQYNHSVEV